MSRGSARIAVVGDSHSPFTERKPFEWALREIKGFKPTHIVHLGDLLEADAASTFYNEYDHDLLDEYGDAAEVLEALEATSPNAQRVWMLGNHDHRICANDPRRTSKKFRRALHWSQSRKYGHIFDRWRQFPYRFDEKGVFCVGQVAMFHDFNGKWDLNALDLNHKLGGYAHRLFVSGHRHGVYGPTRIYRTPKVPLDTWGASPGTHGPLRPEWVQQQSTRWGHGLCLIEALKGRACQPAKNWECTTLEYGAK